MSDSGYCREDASLRDTVPDDTACIEWIYDGHGALVLKHYNAAFNCCTDFLDVDINISGNNISIHEDDSLLGNPCPCLCLWDVGMQIVNLGPGEYNIVVNEPYLTGDDPPFNFTIDLVPEPSGRFCLPRNEYPWGELKE